jgi:hypothetical protein
MANFNLDRIRFKWRNIWSGSTVYTKDDIVYYEGKTYVCLIGHTSNAINLTTDLQDAAPKWELMFDGCVWKQDWTTETYYTVGDIVKFKGYVYQCITTHTSTNLINLRLPVDIEYWTIVATTYNWLDEWIVNSYYDLGDVVRYNGITYICIEKHRSASTPDLGLENDQEKWEIVTRSDFWTTDWSINERYKVDDIVKYGAIVYRCIEEHTSATSLTHGLELDQAKWEIVTSGIEYKIDWNTETRYKLNDIVKWGPTLWICVTPHTSGETNLRDDEANWEVWMPGTGYETLWEAAIEYQKGDIVLYGGYTYTALENNLNSVPSVNGILQDTGDWELLKTGYKHRGEWDIDAAYYTGDVVRNYGYLYIALLDSTGQYPDTGPYWQELVTGKHWKAEWNDNTEYFLGDVVTYAGVTYTCVQRHTGIESDNRPDLDIENETDNYWIVLLQGTPSNVMTSIGDMRTYGNTGTERLGIGSRGSILKSTSIAANWQNYEVVKNVYYVALEGQDTLLNGLSLNSPFRTIKYAMEYIQADLENRAPATVFVKTGVFQEELPISIPADVALVGDELRSTNIQPAPGYEAEDMFYMRNGSGLRNCTLQGLAGELPDTRNTFGTKFPTGGAFVSLDPGEGPDDETVWITTKSPYVQNVSTFGTACIGMRIDGTVHSSGNKSIVANDFTQIISDGIGYWANEAGRSELVSVFTYFCYIGYYATNGGILRATNGNNSYGTYGSRAEGYSLFETPITAEVDNRTLEAQVNIVHTTGSEVFALGYDHAGQEYTTATGTIAGTGVGATVSYEEFRDNAISQIRVIDPSDSSVPGGLNYQYLLNTAQEGNEYQIKLSAADDSGTPEKYINQRIVIVSGKGVGQYGIISGYDPLTKIAVISKEYNDTNGWENLYPGRPIAPVLDSTTRYSIEPRVIIDDPGWAFSSPSITWPAGFVVNDVLDVKYTAGKYIAIDGSGNSAISDDGETFTGSDNVIVSSTAPGGFSLSTTSSTAAYFLEATGVIKKYTVGTDSWSTITLPAETYTHIATDSANETSIAIFGTQDGWAKTNSDGSVQSNGMFFAITGGASPAGIAYGNGTWVVVAGDGDVAVSTDGSTWTETTGAISGTSTWNSIAYGNGRFVVVGENVDGATSAYSFDGVTWYRDDTNLSLLPDSNLQRVVYQNGQFIAFQMSASTTTIARSKDGFAWQWFDDGSTAYTLPVTSGVTSAAGPDLWVIAPGSSTYYKYITGAGAVARAVIASSRIQSFIMYDPGANYQDIPGVLVFDNEATIDALDLPRINNGVLPQPVFTNKGSGYVTATATVSGNGFADIYQTGKTINLKNLSLVPGLGANIVFDSIDDVIYRLTAVVDQSGSSPFITSTFNISPPLTNQNSPEHEEGIIIRELYSQIRLTGHDFLDIGVGNKESTNYPELYVEGYEVGNVPAPEDEVTQFNGGRVFYTSTDQDGNFRVGELFAVEQNTGIVSINADFFELDGLTELSLGAIQVGGSAVVIREFSKEETFIANSNNIVPTQAAIISYLESRISGGGADAVTNTLLAGQVRITQNNISTTSGLQINVPVQVNMAKGIDGDYLAHQFFLSKK